MRVAYDHVLGPLRDRAVEAHEVAPLERLEPEVVVLEVAVVDDGRVDRVLVLLHRGVGLVGDERRGFFVLGCTCLWSFSTTSENVLSVVLWRFDTEMRAASTLKSGCCVVM